MMVKTPEDRTHLSSMISIFVYFMILSMIFEQVFIHF